MDDTVTQPHTHREVAVDVPKTSNRGIEESVRQSRIDRDFLDKCVSEFRHLHKRIEESGNAPGIDAIRDLKKHPLFSLYELMCRSRDLAGFTVAQSPSVLASFSEEQIAYVRPEFTEALVQHMHEAKRLAILDLEG